MLRQTAQSLTSAEIRSAPVQQLIEFMRATMYDAPGVGLAAPQIGESLQLAVIEDKEIYHQNLSEEELKLRKRKPIPFHVIVNPKLTIIKKKSVDFYEGCLSMAGFVGVVPRHLAVKVECLNEKGEPVMINAEGWYARILQHEIDHLHGILCVDRTLSHTLSTFDNYNRYHAKV